MKASKLSLGPLVVNPQLLSQICKADGSMQVAQVDCFHPASVTIEYACLFAAAPEMLEALQHILQYDDAALGSIGHILAREAVAKAIGGAA